MKSAGSWERIFFEWKTNFVRYRSGSLEVRTLVQLEPKLSIILNDAYWENLCICEVNRVLGAEGLASIITNQRRFNHHGGTEARSPDDNRFAPGRGPGPRGRHVYGARPASQRPWTQPWPMETRFSGSSTSWSGRRAT